MNPKRILFVCTGNSCRSVMAQGLLQHRLKQMEQQLTQPIEVDSAGVFAIQGMPPSRETLRLLEQEGVDLSTHMAQSVTEEQLRQAHAVFAMEWFHMEEVVRRLAEAKGKVRLLKPFGLPEGQAVGDPNIGDPIGKPPEVYEQCFSLIRVAVERVARAIVDGTL